MSETCDSCGCEYDYIYWCPDEVWHFIKPTDEGGLLCLDCVHHRAKKHGYVLRFTGHANWWGEEAENP